METISYLCGSYMLEVTGIVGDTVVLAGIYNRIPYIKTCYVKEFTHHGILPHEILDKIITFVAEEDSENNLYNIDGINVYSFEAQ